jgi:hypothetical protein
MANYTFRYFGHLRRIEALTHQNCQIINYKIYFWKKKKERKGEKQKQKQNKKG